MSFQQPSASVQDHYGRMGQPTRPGMQELPVENLRFDPFHHILLRVQGHPDAAYAIHDVEGPSDAPLPDDCGPEPVDLDERFHWHVSKRVQSVLGRLLTQQARQAHAQRKHRGYHTAVHGLSANDPLYERTMDIMHHYLEKLPELFKPLVMPVLARHSPSFMALYQELRHAAETVENHLHHQGKKRTARAKTPQEPSRADDANAAARAAELQALKERVRRGGAKEGDLYKYLDLTGMIS